MRENDHRPIPATDYDLRELGKHVVTVLKYSYNIIIQQGSLNRNYTISNIH